MLPEELRPAPGEGVYSGSSSLKLAVPLGAMVGEDVEVAQELLPEVGIRRDPLAANPDRSLHSSLHPAHVVHIVIEKTSAPRTSPRPEPSASQRHVARAAGPRKRHPVEDESQQEGTWSTMAFSSRSSSRIMSGVAVGPDRQIKPESLQIAPAPSQNGLVCVLPLSHSLTFTHPLYLPPFIQRIFSLTLRQREDHGGARMVAAAGLPRGQRKRGAALVFSRLCGGAHLGRLSARIALRHVPAGAHCIRHWDHGVYVFLCVCLCVRALPRDSCISPRPSPLRLLRSWRP